MSIEAPVRARPGPQLRYGRSVAVCHPGKQHSYETAAALHANDLLLAFLTGVYLYEGALARSVRILARATPGGLADRAARGRRKDELADAPIVTFPLRLMATKAAARVPGLETAWRWAEYSIDRSIARWIASATPAPAAVHAFEGGSLATLGAARRVGAVTVLDVPNAHEVGRAAAAAYGAWRTPETVTERVRQERSLADWLLAPSDLVRSCLVENGIAPERVVLLPYGVDADVFHPAEPRGGASLRVLYVGRLTHIKGVHHLLSAWRRLALPDAELVLAGGATSEGRALLRDLPPRVSWLGPLAHGVLPELFRSADLFVFPSLCEGSALVTYEAMASGLPLVVSDHAGSVARDGIDGKVVPAGDVDALEFALRDLCEQHERRVAMGRSARRRVVESYTWAHYAGRLASFYREVIA